MVVRRPEHDENRNKNTKKHKAQREERSLNRIQVESPFVRRDNIPKRVESEVLQESISRALAISHGYARFASRLNECSYVIMSLVLAVCLAAQKECHQIWRCVVLLLLRESAIVLTPLDAAPRPSLIPKVIVLLKTNVNTRVTSTS